MDRGQEQPDEDSDDCNDDQQLDKRESESASETEVLTAWAGKRGRSCEGGHAGDFIAVGGFNFWLARLRNPSRGWLGQ